MAGYVLATDADDVERRRMSLLFAYNGALTIEVLKAAAISRGWRCLEVGAGGGDITRWLADGVAPGGSVIAVDPETHWVEPLAGEVVEVRRGDLGQLDLAQASFHLVAAQMLLLHLPEPGSSRETAASPTCITASSGEVAVSRDYDSDSKSGSQAAARTCISRKENGLRDLDRVLTFGGRRRPARQRAGHLDDRHRRGQVEAASARVGVRCPATSTRGGNHV